MIKTSWKMMSFLLVVYGAIGCVGEGGHEHAGSPNLLTEVPYCVSATHCDSTYGSQAGQLLLGALASGEAFTVKDGSSVGSLTKSYEFSTGNLAMTGSQTCGTLDLTFNSGSGRVAFGVGSFDPDSVSLAYRPLESLNGKATHVLKLNGKILTHIGNDREVFKTRRDAIIGHCSGLLKNSPNLLLPSGCYRDYTEGTVCKIVSTQPAGIASRQCSPGLVGYNCEWVVSYTQGSYTMCPKNFDVRTVADFGVGAPPYAPTRDNIGMVTVDLDTSEIVAVDGTVEPFAYSPYSEADWRLGAIKATPLEIMPSDFKLTSSGTLMVSFDCKKPEGTSMPLMLALATVSQVTSGAGGTTGTAVSNSTAIKTSVPVAGAGAAGSTNSAGAAAAN